MGTQSRETVAMEAALAQDALRPTGEAADQSLFEPAEAGGRIGDAAGWALGKAKDTLQSAAEAARDRAATAVAAYTRDDPIRAILIAAGAGAVLMGLLSMMARSGARTVERKVRRIRR
jgi:ElaB/YqjD/DUF883 family membrane-anchored ribosome-binding protein